MSRILLATLGSLGDLHPLIAIGLVLHSRGHAVRFCTCETYRAKIESLGFGFEPLRPDATPENASVAPLVKEIMDPKKGVERLVRGFVMPRLKATYSDLHRAVSGAMPIDLLVSGELVYPAPLIAEKTGILWATHITAPMSFFSAYDPPVLPPFPKLSRLFRVLGPRINGGIIRLVKSNTRNWGAPVRRLRAQLGLPEGNDPIHEGKFSPRLVLATFSPVLATPRPDWPTHTIVTGFPFYDGAADGPALPPELEGFLAAGDSPIVFTLGSSAVLDPGNFYSESAEAARLLRRRAVLLVGRNPLPAKLPDGIVAFGYVRFSALFPRASVVVHQGGIGTTGQAMRAGCPMLVMPYNFDQPDNAARLARLGVSRTIPRGKYSANRVARDLEQLLGDSKYRCNATEISRKLQRERGAEVACDALEGLLR